MAGKGGRQAKGGRGKKGSNPRDQKPVRSVKASELAEASSDDDEEVDTLHVLRSLLRSGGRIPSESSGSAVDSLLGKKGRRKKGDCERGM